MLAQAGQLAERDDRAGKGDRADESADEQLELVAAWQRVGMPNAAGLCTTAMAISTAAIPTSECMAATSSGICVISTRLATIAPMMPPMAMPSDDQRQLLASSAAW